MIITVGRKMVCCNALLVSPPNPLALQKWEWQRICILQVQCDNVPQGDSSSPTTLPLLFTLSFCSSCCWCAATLRRRFLHGLWVGNSVLELKLARNWAPDLCSASVLWEGMEAPMSQGVLLGQFWALGIKAILPLYCCVFLGEGEDNERAQAGLFETWHSVVLLYFPNNSWQRP